MTNLSVFDVEATESLPIAVSKLAPILKWPGGKEQELKYIRPHLPQAIDRFFEPFVGGGAVYTAVEAEHYFINDRSIELIGLYRSLRSEERELFFVALQEIIHNWNLLTKVAEDNHKYFYHTYKDFSTGKISEESIHQKLLGFILQNSEQFNGMFSERFNFNASNFLHELQTNVFRKVSRMKHLEGIKQILPEADVVSNIETAMKSAFYMHFRHIYNFADHYHLSQPVRSAIFLFIRNFAYSGMFRYNSSGHFNVPYGGMGYNRKNFQKKVNYLRSELLFDLLGHTTIEADDFEVFLTAYQPRPGDFVFLDPPYDSEFSTYSQNEFTKDDQVRLANYLIEKCRSKWMLVVKNTSLIQELYFSQGLNILSFDKTYLVSFMNRNDRNTEHLLVRNY